MGIANNPPPMFHGYALVSRYVGGTKDYSMTGGVIESFIDTRTFPFEHIKGAGPQRILQINNQLPLHGNVFSFDLAVPEFQGDGVGQVTFVLYAHDGDGKTFAVVFSAWDNRYDTHGTSVMYDYQVPFAATPIRNTRYCTVLHGGSTMFSGTSEDLRPFRFTLTDKNLSAIVEDLNVWQRNMERPEFLPDLGGYRLGLTGILHETFLLDSPYKKVINRVRFRGIRIEREVPQQSDLQEMWHEGKKPDAPDGLRSNRVTEPCLAQGFLFEA